jgi:putative ABC transport system ATP-binding protein
MDLRIATVQVLNSYKYCGMGGHMAYIQFENVKKTYGSGDAKIDALAGVSFGIEHGEFCILLGSSGAGKTTLLNMLGGMDTITSGKIVFDGREISSMGKRALVEYRRHDVGFVFQFYNLIPNLTALENVEIAAQLCKNPIPADEALKMVGLSGRANNFPAQLSGGEQQRVAIARALAKNPRLLLCDEPTGALDYATGKAVLKLLYDLSRKQDTTVIIITHNQAIAPMADRIIRIRSGKIESNERNEHVIPIEEIEW